MYMQYQYPDFHSPELQNHYRLMANQCNSRPGCDERYEGGERIGSCNVATANAMQNRNAFDENRVIRDLPIPRDYLTMTTTPEAHPAFQTCYLDANPKTCKKCNTSYECTKDVDRHFCFECSRQKYNAENKFKSYDPYATCFMTYVRPAI